MTLSVNPSPVERTTAIFAPLLSQSASSMFSSIGRGVPPPRGPIANVPTKRSPITKRRLSDSASSPARTASTSLRTW